MTYETPQEPQDLAPPTNPDTDETTSAAGDAAAPVVGDRFASDQSVDLDFASRLQRIHENYKEAQMERDPLVSSLSSVNSDLLWYELVLNERLREAIEANGLSLDDLQKHSAPVGLLLKIIKQINQTTQLKRQCQKDGDDAADSEGQDSAESEEIAFLRPK
jgi:hypothetical protein